MAQFDVEAMLDAQLQQATTPPPDSTTPPTTGTPSTQRPEERDEKSRGRDEERHKRRHRSRSPRHRSRSRSRERKRHRSRSRSRERRRHRSRSRSRSPRGRGRDSDRRRKEREEPPEPPKPIDQGERDARTVFVFNLHLKATDEDIKKFFSKVGKVRDVRLITDRNSRKSKGVGYVEFADRGSIASALSLTGTPLLGKPIQIQQTHAEKNRTTVQVTRKPMATPAGPTRLYVGSLHFNTTENVLFEVFSQHGEIDFINLHMDPETNRSKGFGFIQYKRPEDAKKALQKCNGMEVHGRRIKVGLVTENKAAAQAAHQEGVHELDDEENGVSLKDAASRALLMQKLQRESIFPTEGDKISQQPSTPPPQPPQPVVPINKILLRPKIFISTPCILLKNMFNPGEETGSDWPQEIEGDVKEECSKYGPVVHIYVDKDSEGFVWLKFASIPAAQNAVHQLSGRWFAGKQIEAEFITEEKYYSRFPEAFSK